MLTTKLERFCAASKDSSVKSRRAMPLQNCEVVEKVNKFWRNVSGLLCFQGTRRFPACVAHGPGQRGLGQTSREICSSLCLRCQEKFNGAVQQSAAVNWWRDGKTDQLHACLRGNPLQSGRATHHCDKAVILSKTGFKSLLSKVDRRRPASPDPVMPPCYHAMKTEFPVKSKPSHRTSSKANKEERCFYPYLM